MRSTYCDMQCALYIFFYMYLFHDNKLIVYFELGLPNYHVTNTFSVIVSIYNKYTYVFQIGMLKCRDAIKFARKMALS